MTDENRIVGQPFARRGEASGEDGWLPETIAGLNPEP